MSAYRIQMNQGETYTATVQWVGTNLSGASAKMQVRDKAGGTVLATFSSPSSGLVVTASVVTAAGTGGTIGLTVPAATSAAWSFQHAVYDILVTLADTTTKRLLEGDIYIDPQVTV